MISRKGAGGAFITGAEQRRTLLQESLGRK